MKKEGKDLYRYGLIFLSFILITPVVFAQGFFDFLYGTTLSSLYESSFEWWDFFLYLTIFGALGRIVFEKRFQGHRSADLLAVGIAVALSLALVYYETTVLGQSLIMVGGFPILITMSILLAIGIFSLAKKRFGIVGALLTALLILLLLPYILTNIPGMNVPSSISNPLRDYGGIIILILIIIFLFIFFKNVFVGYKGGEVNWPNEAGRATGHVKNWWPFKKKPKLGQQQIPQQQPQVNQQQMMQAIANMKDHLEHIADRSAQLNILIGRVINDTRKSPANDPIKGIISSVYNYRINAKSYDNIKRILSIIRNPSTKDSDRKSALVLLENSLTDILNSVQGIMKVLKDINNPVDGYLRSKNVKFRIYLIAKYIGQLSSQLIPYSQKIRSNIP